jgi:outer membrane protein assembly factor BamB
MIFSIPKNDEMTFYYIKKGGNVLCLGIICFLFQAMSCHHDDEIPYDYVAPQWGINLHKNNIQSNSIIRGNLIFDGKALLATTDGIDNRFISCIDAKNGNELWRWNNIYQPPTEYFDIDYFLQYDDLFFYQVGTRSYCINLDDGSTYFKNRGNISFNTRFSSYQSSAFLIGKIADTVSGRMVYGVNILDIQTGVITPFLTPPLDSGIINSDYHGVGDFSEAIMTSDGKFLAVTYGFKDSLNNVVPKLGLYDLVNNNWRYKNISLTDQPKWSTGINLIPVIYDGKIYISVGTFLVCHNLWNGKRIWQTDFHSDFLFSGYIIEDGQLLANSENSIFYCINPETGVIKWHVEGAGTSTPLRYLNGIVYFSGGSTGQIHAIDTNTGEYVWMLDPANYNHQEDFKPDLYVTPGVNGEKGKVIICTPEKAYCLPAYR